MLKCFRELFYSGCLLPPSLLVSMSESGGIRYGKKPVQPVLEIAVSLDGRQRSTSLPFCVYPETTASFQSVPHLCIYCCLLPLPKDLFLSVFPLCFSPQISHSHRQMNYLQEGCKWKRRGVDLWNSGWGLLMCAGSKAELLMLWKTCV